MDTTDQLSEAFLVFQDRLSTLQQTIELLVEKFQSLMEKLTECLREALSETKEKKINSVFVTIVEIEPLDPFESVKNRGPPRYFNVVKI